MQSDRDITGVSLGLLLRLISFHISFQAPQSLEIKKVRNTLIDLLSESHICANECMPACTIVSPLIKFSALAIRRLGCHSIRFRKTIS